jgi:hypothetical protein
MRQRRRYRGWFLALLAAQMAVGGAAALAESPPIVVAAREELAQTVARLAGEVVRVEVLRDEAETGYEPLQARAWAVREGVLFVFDSTAEDTIDHFWRERLTAQHYVCPAVDLGRATALCPDLRHERRLRCLHGELVRLFPEHRRRLDIQLESELRRGGPALDVTPLATR